MHRLVPSVAGSGPGRCTNSSREGPKMKIALLAVANTAFLHLKGPDDVYLYEGEEPVGIDLFGPGSPEYARIEERQGGRVVKRMSDNDNRLSHVPIETQRAERAEDLASLTAGFRHIEHDDENGAPLAGTALFTAVYADPTLGWIAKQVTKFVGDWGKFKRGSGAN